MRMSAFWDQRLLPECNWRWNKGTQNPVGEQHKVNGEELILPSQVTPVVSNFLISNAFHVTLTAVRQGTSNFCLYYIYIPRADVFFCFLFFSNPCLRCCQSQKIVSGVIIPVHFQWAPNTSYNTFFSQILFGLYNFYGLNKSCSVCTGLLKTAGSKHLTSWLC